MHAIEFFPFVLLKSKLSEFVFYFHGNTGHWGKEEGGFILCVCEVGIVGKICDCQPGGPGFNLRPGRGLNFGRPSFATLSVDRDVKPLV